MSSYLSGIFWILSRHEYKTDLLLECVSPQFGRINLIAKHAASPKSKRSNLLNVGYIIKAKLYFRYHYYLSEVEVDETFYPFRQNLRNITFFYYVLKVVKYYVNDDSKLLLTIIKTLKYIKSLEKSKQSIYLFALIIYIFRFFSVMKSTFRCKKCSKKIIQGVYCNGDFFCDQHNPKDSRNLCIHFNIQSFDNKIKFIQEILAYNEGFDYILLKF